MQANVATTFREKRAKQDKDCDQIVLLLIRIHKFKIRQQTLDCTYHLNTVVQSELSYDRGNNTTTDIIQIQNFLSVSFLLNLQ